MLQGGGRNRVRSTSAWSAARGRRSIDHDRERDCCPEILLRWPRYIPDQERKKGIAWPNSIPMLLKSDRSSYADPTVNAGAAGPPRITRTKKSGNF